jgi:hypothetical protein
MGSAAAAQIAAIFLRVYCGSEGRPIGVAASMSGRGCRVVVVMR